MSYGGPHTIALVVGCKVGLLCDWLGFLFPVSIIECTM